MPWLHWTVELCHTSVFVLPKWLGHLSKSCFVQHLILLQNISNSLQKRSTLSSKPAFHHQKRLKNVQFNYSMHSWQILFLEFQKDSLKQAQNIVLYECVISACFFFPILLDNKFSKRPVIKTVKKKISYWFFYTTIWHYLAVLS